MRARGHGGRGGSVTQRGTEAGTGRGQSDTEGETMRGQSDTEEETGRV